MWPLSTFLLFAMAAPPQQNAPPPFHRSNPAMQLRQLDRAPARGLLESGQTQGCYFIRSYFFRRQDGQAPVPAGMTTCTPASVLRQRQVSQYPDVQFVPLTDQR
jgi:hypothetical protein